MKSMKWFWSVITLAAVSLVCGCGANYVWRSSVPEAMRTVSVPTFRNETNVAELGPIAARQLLREFQREGTFKIRTNGDAALEIQGVLKSANASVGAYDRRTGLRMSAYDFNAVAEVSVIDKRSRKVLIDNRVYKVKTVFTSGQDLTTSMRDASGRLMDELARQVVDDMVDLKFEDKKAEVNHE